MNEDKQEENIPKSLTKNRKPMIKVLVFAACFLVFICLLTIERNIILEREAAQKLAENKAKVVENGNKEASNVVGNSGNRGFKQLNYDVSDLLDNEMVQDLPKEAVIELRLGDDYYTVSRDSIVAGRPQNPDLTITLPANYAGQISNGLCEMIKQANSKRDLAIETYASQTSLMWKYRGMLKYKECLS
jgi:hypothetical protein